MAAISQFGTGDLAGVVIQRDHEFAGYAEAVIRSWNSDTFEHTINVRGSDLHNLDVCSGIEALTYQPGDMVILTRWKPRSRRGSATYRIGGGGRIIRPGTGAAEAAISALRTNAAKALSAEIFGERVHGADESGSTGFITSSSYVSHVDGPEVTDVPISAAGIALVTVTTEITVTVGTGQEDAGGRMSFEVSGASSVAADDARSAWIDLGKLNHGGIITRNSARSSAQTVLTGLNEGLHTFAARYKNPFGATPNPVFIRRSISVIGL